MNLYHLSTTAALGGAACLLIFLLAGRLRKIVHDRGAGSISLRQVIFLLAVWAGVIGWNHQAYPLQHRLYYDEDVYANMALNVLQGYGATVTAMRVGEVKEVHGYKWPPGFPTLMAPFVAAFGAEKGPARFNQLCGALTALLLAALGYRLTASVVGAYGALLIYGLHPLAGGWYHAGSSEPLAVLLTALALWAALECRFRSRDAGQDGSDWFLLSVLAGLLAMLVRLENVLLVLPLVLLLRKARLRFAARHYLILFLAAVPLLLCLAGHVATLKPYYLADVPESTFFPALVLNNLRANIEFLLIYVPGPFLGLMVIAAFCGIILARRQGVKLNLTPWIVVLLIPLLHFGILLFYSVGQYHAPGGSRFFLVQLLGIAVIGATLLAQWPFPRYRPWLMLAGMLCYLVLLPDRTGVWQYFDSQNESAVTEHVAILEWAQSLPEGAVVLSRLPCLWENCGVYTAAPEYAGDPTVAGSAAIYEHYGLFNLSAGLPPPEGEAVESVPTPDGTVGLYRLRKR